MHAYIVPNSPAPANTAFENGVAWAGPVCYNSGMADNTDNLAALREERLNLEREALELERRRFEEMKAHEATVSKLSTTRKSSMAAAALSAAIAFLLGVLVGAGYAEHRAQRAKSARLRDALAQLKGVDIDEIQSHLGSATNSPAAKPSAGPVGAHRNVSVIVVE